MFRRVMAAIALLPWLAATAAAHNFWIEPSTYRREKAGPVTFSLRVGVGFEGDAVPRDKSRIERFVVAGPKGDKDVVGLDGEDPAGLLRLEDEGLYVVAYRSLRRAITLEAKKFEAYLADEGLDDVLAWRKEHGEAAKDGNEVYSRAAKSVVRVGADPSDASSPNAKAVASFDRVFDFPFELVPESDPLLARSGDSLKVRVLVDGKPAEKILVGAMRKGDTKDAASVRSDAGGHVTLALDRPGVWLVHSVHMRRAPAETKADWESIWASLTFDVRAKAPVSPTPQPAR